MRILVVLVFVALSFSCFACWKIEAQIDIHNEHVTINQKIIHDKIYSFASGPYLIDIKMPDSDHVVWSVNEKKGITLIKHFTKTIIVKLNAPIKREAIKMKDNQFALMNLNVSEI